MKKKILFVTERRADYSKLRPIIDQVKKSKKFDYYLVVTGSHLLRKQGYTINEIKKDGFKIYKKFNMFEENEDDSEDTRLQMAIQLSLEGVNNPLTIDVEDYNISQLFN